MANTKPEILPFAVDNTSDCEHYLFLNHPTTFLSLTTDSKDEHHSPPCSPKSTPLKSILKPSTLHHTVTFTPPPTAPAPGPAPMERHPSASSTTSSNDDGYLGGGALRHIGGSHHLQDLAELAELDQQAKARRRAGQQTHAANLGKAVRKPKEERPDWLATALAWWPENVEMMEHEWTEEFYE